MIAKSFASFSLHARLSLGCAGAEYKNYFMHLRYAY